MERFVPFRALSLIELIADNVSQPSEPQSSMNTLPDDDVFHDGLLALQAAFRTLSVR